MTDNKSIFSDEEITSTFMEMLKDGYFEEVIVDGITKYQMTEKGKKLAQEQHNG